MKTMFIFFFLLASVLSAENRYRLDTLIVEGAKSVSNPVSLFPGKEKDTLSLEEADKRFRVFKEAYEKEAVISCGFVLEKKTDSTALRLILKILVCEDPFVRSITFEGNASVPSERLKALMSLGEGRCFADDSLENDILRMKRRYEAQNILSDISVRVLGGREKRLFFSIEESPAGLLVRIRGNRAFSGNRVRESCRISADNRADVRVLRAEGLPELRRQYYRAGFFNARLDLKVLADTALLSIEEGDRARIAGIVLSGNRRFPADTLLHYAEFRKGEAFSRERVKSIAGSMLAYYEDRGFPFCEITLEPPSCGADSLVLAMAVSENGRFTLGGFLPHGNAFTRPDAMVRLAGFRKGEAFSASGMARMQGRLFKCGLFERVDPLFVTAREGVRVLDVHARVLESLQNSLEGVLGYNPEAEGHPLSGFFTLALNNVAGTCRKLRLDYLKEDPLTRGEFRYLEPWLLGSRVDGEVSAVFRMEEPDFALWEAQVRVNAPIGDHVKCFAGLMRSAHTYPQGEGGAPVTEDVTSTLAGAETDYRDFPENPRRGWSAALPVYYRYKKGRDRAYDEIKVLLDAECFLPLRASQVIAFLGAYRGLFTQDDSLSRGELFPLGGSTTLRGYREGQFRGASVLFGRMEYRFLTGLRSRLLLFFDAGGADGSPLFQGFHFPGDLLFGYGGGLALMSRAGLIGVEYGLSRGNAFADGKIHLRLRNNF